MRKFQRHYLKFATICIALIASIYIADASSYDIYRISLTEIESLTNGEWPDPGCQRLHINNCHEGGLGSISCSIDASVHACIGGMGGGCSVTCSTGYSACCGLECKCLPNSSFIGL